MVVRKGQNSYRSNEVNTNNLITIPTTKTKTKFIRLSQINARSIVNKHLEFQTQLLQDNVDLCAITETWLKKDDDFTLKCFLPPGYTITSQLRTGGRMGGGIALVCKKSIQTRIINMTNKSITMEYSALTCNINGNNLDLYIIYRYPQTSVIIFCEELANILEQNIVTDRGEFILVGDFNIHVDKLDEPDTVTFKDFLESFNLVNHVHFSTQKSHHTLDLVLSDRNSTWIKETNTVEDIYYQIIVLYTLH